MNANIASRTSSVASAIAAQTFRDTDSETGRAMFADRLRALSHARATLNDTRWTTCPCRNW